MENKEIEELIDRFFEGLTSNREEKELYAFFAQEDIPGYLRKYKPVFAYFENGMQNKKPKRKQLWIWTSVAASLLILIGLRVFYPKDNPDLDSYDGSYIIRKGVKITDPELIRLEIERSLYHVSMLEEISIHMQDQFENQEIICEQ